MLDEWVRAMIHFPHQLTVFCIASAEVVPDCIDDLNSARPGNPSRGLVTTSAAPTRHPGRAHVLHTSTRHKESLPCLLPIQILARSQRHPDRPQRQLEERRIPYSCSREI